ncbi:unnamed protein product [Calicophoron daubneyi]|uniref:E2 ubiquitin-conjugating enzyme n=1 Tax=Calicophoron daubneyi TaxID=300641 RepID=A0AAV2TWB8_CALDB
MENIYPHVVKRISKEIHEVLSSPIEGVQVIVNDQDLTDIQAIIDGPTDTPYEGGKFRIKLVISDGYPNNPPKGYFFTKVFHPNIAPLTGEICVNTLKRDWKSDLGLRHILLTIKCLLMDPNPESALNEEAGRLLLEDYDEYVAQARLYTDIHARHHFPGDQQNSQPVSNGATEISAKPAQNGSDQGKM